MRKIFLAVLFLSQVLIIQPARADQTVLYQSVHAATKWDNGDLISRAFENDNGIPSFIVEQNNLYLKIQSTRTKWWLWVEVDQPKWDATSVADLVRQHPELAALLPDAHTSNGGIKWIEHNALYPASVARATRAI